MALAEVVQFSESFRRRALAPPAPAEISREVTHIDAFRYQRVRRAVERRAMRSLLREGDGG